MFKRDRRLRASQCRCGFNPSVGILGVQAERGEYAYEEMEKFQSLGRDSGCSSDDETAFVRLVIAVSIPRSGFWVFKHPCTRHWPSGGGRVSIPRSGFWVFKLA